MDEIRAELIAMDNYDQEVRSELAANGSLYDGYHPRMAAVHDAHAVRLEEIIDRHGWPTEPLVGEEGARAAHRIAQHSINDPRFMRRCRQLLDEASSRGEVPRAQFAYIDDRIRVFEGLPQRFGTQWRDGPNGLEPYPLEDSERVDELRAELGLPSMAEMQATLPREKPFDKEAARVLTERELEWRREVGWI